MPDSFWNLERLRHMHINNRVTFCLQEDNVENTSLLENMDTLSTPALSYGEDTEKNLRRLPKLRKLRCIFLELWDNLSKFNKFPILDFLSHLQSLKIFYHGMIRYPCDFSFPSNLKKLTLLRFRLPWS
ncbi:hypothetical protein ACH5RR_026477 [Cinchona calisaya]|uniref:Uncharacterized protein n=1 Tax=Cinchona calisaya TaxID=153742 RepID=A0ABD2Z601_9GENT